MPSLDTMREDSDTYSGDLTDYRLPWETFISMSGFWGSRSKNYDGEVEGPYREGSGIVI